MGTETMFMNIIPTISNKTMAMDKYFIYAQTINGARFYSEPLVATEINRRFDEYCGMAHYFGGGIVVMCAYKNDDYEKLYDKVIL